MATKKAIEDAIKSGKIVNAESARFFFMTELFNEVKELKLNQIIESKIDDFLAKIKVIKGSDGKTPTKNELLALIKPLIPVPEDGHTPTRNELLTLIKPLIPAVKNGETPTKESILKIITPYLPTINYEFIKEEIVRLMPKIDEIEKNMPMLGEQIRDALELLNGDERLDASAIKGLPDFIDKTNQVVLGGYGGLNLYVAGKKIGATKTLDFEGVTFAKVNGRPTITISTPTGFVNYKGLLNASTSGYPVGASKGDYYIISVAGTIEGTHYGIGDWIVFDGTYFDKIDNQQGAGPNVISTYTDDFTVGLTDTTAVCNKATDLIANLPAATGTGRIIIIKNIGAGNATITPNGSETIDGETNQTLYPYEAISVQDYASGAWLVI